MRNRWKLIAILAICVSLMVAGSSVLGVAEKREDALSAISQRDTLAQQIKRYLELREQQPDTIHGTKPQADFEMRISSSLDAAGLNPRTRYTIRTNADREHRDGQQQLTGLRQQRATVEIPGLTTAQIGRLLIHWERSQQMWAPERIELIHDQRSDQDIYSLRLECLAVYYAQGSE